MEQFAEIGLFDLIEAPAAILCWEAPAIRRGPDKGSARGFVVAEIEKLISDYFIDDPRQFASGLAAFSLQLPGRDIKFVDHTLEDSDEDHILGAGVL